MDKTEASSENQTWQMDCMSIAPKALQCMPHIHTPPAEAAMKGPPRAIRGPRTRQWG